MLFIALLMPTLFSVNGDLFSSIVDMEELFKDEANLIKDLSDYTEKLQETLEHVRRYDKYENNFLHHNHKNATKVVCLALKVQHMFKTFSSSIFVLLNYFRV